MKSFFLTCILSISIIFFSLSSCKKDEDVNPTPAPTAGLIKIAETYVTGAAAKAVLYAADSLQTGYNEIFTLFYDSLTGNKLLDCHFHIHPTIDHNDEELGAPSENPESAVPENGLFRSMVVFHQAGKWMLHMHLHNHKNDLDGETELEMHVRESNPSPLIMLEDSLLIALVKPLKPLTGVNDLEITMHRKASNAEYTAAEDYTVEIEPLMPSMGHGSPNNQNPVHVSKGYYRGKVNFSMSGLWRIRLKLSKNGKLISDDRYFEVKL